MFVLRLSRRRLMAAAAALLLAGSFLAVGGRALAPGGEGCGEQPGPETGAGAAEPTTWTAAWARMLTELVGLDRTAEAARDDEGGPIQVGNPERLRIVIDRYTQTLTLYEDEREVIRFPVAVGKPATPSPPGEWRIVNKDRGWGGGFGTRWLGLNVPWGIYGIHGTNKPWSIGRFESAGCIRMFNRDVERLWDVVPRGTTVTITGDLPEVSGREHIEEGAAGKFIMVLQFRLRQAGFDFGDLDARYGPATAEAVRDFQTLYGFEPTGALTRDQQRLLWYPE